MRIDLHVQTAPLSRKALQTPDQAFRAAKECGLDGIALMETNVLRHSLGFMSLCDKARGFGLTVFHGLYLHTTHGPLLVYGHSIGQAGTGGLKIDSMPDTMAAVDYCLENGWSVVLAHPFRFGIGPEEGLCHRFKDAIEPVVRAIEEVGFLVRKMHGIQISASATKKDNGLAASLAEAMNLPIVVGSGACYHTQIRAGCWTRLPQSMNTNERLAQGMVEAAHKGMNNEVLRLPDLSDIYKTARPSRGR